MRASSLLSLLFLAAALAGPGCAADTRELDFDTLGERIAGTRALGVFTKLSLKGDVDALRGDLGNYHGGQSSETLDSIRERYVLLVQKLVLLLQKKDPDLAREIAAALEPFWEVLADRERFAQL